MLRRFTVGAGEEIPAEIESPTALVTSETAEQALGAFPQPFEEFDNPLAALVPSK